MGKIKNAETKNLCYQETFKRMKREAPERTVFATDITSKELVSKLLRIDKNT